MKTINLFVACPIDSDNLKSLKEDIKKRCLELNAYFANTIEEDKEDKQIKIIPLTYDDPERREEVCKKIIKHRADIVLFLFDGVYDKYLLDELEFAVERSVKFHKPEPLVYINKNNNNPTNNDLDKDIAKILAEGGWISEPFIDSEDLWRKVLDKLERYFNQYHSIRRIQRNAKKRYYGLWIGLPIVAAFAVAFFFAWKNAEINRLLIVGGGSARRYVEGSILKKPNGLKTLIWLYAPMPSGDSYRIMAEESIKNYEKYQDRPYYPIVLSAQKASEKNFLRTSRRDDFKKTGIIIGIQIGEDYLVAYGSKNAIPNEMIISDTAILSTSIDSIIKKQLLLSSSSIVDSTTEKKQTVFYTTSENSGTLNSYFKVCDSLKLREYLSMCEASKEGRRSFSDIDSLPKEKNDSIWIVLGSKYYYPKNTIMKPLTVLNNEKNVQSKPIYIYFMLYKDKDSDTYILPKSTKRFLKKIVENDDKLLNEIRRINSKNTSVININDTTTILYDSFIRTDKKKK